MLNSSGSLSMIVSRPDFKNSTQPTFCQPAARNPSSEPPEPVNVERKRRPFDPFVSLISFMDGTVEESAGLRSCSLSTSPNSDVLMFAAERPETADDLGSL